MADHYAGDDDQGGSYLGLISVLIVIIGFIALLVWAGIGPLKKHEESALHSPAPASTTASTGQPQAQAPGNPPQQVAASGPGLAPSTVLTRIAVGGMIDQTKPLPILPAVLTRRPQAFVFTGNAVLPDIALGGDQICGPLLIGAAYGTLAANADFKPFRDAVPILGTWGDRDYGQAGGGASFPYKAASKEAFLQFYGLSRADIGAHDGIYHARIFGPEGRRVQMIFLDTRTFRSDLRGQPGNYAPDSDPGKTMLGAGQWAWLEQQLIEPADVRLIVSSIPVEGEAGIGERWGHLPHERDRLFSVIRRSDARGVVLVSGDAGAGAVYKNESALAYPLFELSSSGLNAPAGSSPERADPARTGKIVADANFGVVDIDWQARSINLELRDASGQLLQGQSLPLPVEEDI